MKVRRQCVIATALMLVFPALAAANPIIVPDLTKVAATVIVVGAAFVVEMAITTGYLLFVGLSPGTVFAALLPLNIGTYLCVLVPALDFDVPVLIIEVVVVSIEAAAIKVMAVFPLFRRDNFLCLRWRHALGAAAVGNAFSYWVGNMMS